jgi:hypothetical protein
MWLFLRQISVLCGHFSLEKNCEATVSHWPSHISLLGVIYRPTPSLKWGAFLCSSLCFFFHPPPPPPTTTTYPISWFVPTSHTLYWYPEMSTIYSVTVSYTYTAKWHTVTEPATWSLMRNELCSSPNPLQHLLHVHLAQLMPQEWDGTVWKVGLAPV